MKSITLTVVIEDSYESLEITLQAADIPEAEEKIRLLIEQARSPLLREKNILFTSQHAD